MSAYRSRGSAPRAVLSLSLISTLILIVGCRAEHVVGPGPSGASASVGGSDGSASAAPPGSESNYAIQFDGVNDWVNLRPTEVGTPASVTVEAWVRIDRLDKLHFLVTNAEDDANDGFSLVVNPSNNVQFIAAHSSSTKGVVASTTALEAGPWYHVAGTYDADEGVARIYVNGVEEASVAYEPGITYDGGRDLGFGIQTKSLKRDERYLEGALDEVRIWGVARTGEGIAADMYYEIEGSADGLVGYWRMNEGGGTETADATGSPNTGTLTYGPVWIEADWRVATPQTVLDVRIDIKPGDGEDPSPVKVNPGVIPVAIFSADGFDAVNDVDRESLTFGRTGDEESLDRRGRGEPNCGEEDVDGDGRIDLVCKFRSELTGFVAGDEEGVLKGSTLSGTPFEARDAVVVK